MAGTLRILRRDGVGNLAPQILHARAAAVKQCEQLGAGFLAEQSRCELRLGGAEILTEDQVADTLARFDGHDLYAVAVFALASGLRRGEIVSARVSDFELDNARVHVRRTCEQTTHSIRIKEPKTEKSRRTLSLPPFAVSVLRQHLVQVLERRMKLGLGKPDADTLMFPGPDGEMMPPNQLSWLWRSACKHLGAPRVNFHALRHTHASALIAAGLDVLAVSRRLGHADATTTLRVYGHLFKRDDSAAVSAIEAVLRTPRERK